MNIKLIKAGFSLIWKGLTTTESRFTKEELDWLKDGRRMPVVKSIKDRLGYDVRLAGAYVAKYGKQIGLVPYDWCSGMEKKYGDKV